MLDILNVLDESNESNNAASLEVEVLGLDTSVANLVVEEFTCEVVLDTIYFEVEVLNAGDKDIYQSFLVEIYVEDSNNYPGSGQPGLYTKEVLSLASGESLFWQEELKGISDGETWAWVIADSQSHIQESEEVDNFSAPCITVVTVSPEPSPSGDLSAVLDAATDNPASADEGFAATDSLPSPEGSGSDCGCRIDAPRPAGAGVWLLLLLAGLLALALRVTKQKDHPIHHAHE